IATGYGVGVALVWLYQFLEFRNPGDRLQRVSKIAACVSVSVIFVFALWQMTFWQNSVRVLMEMPIVESSYPYRFAAIAVVGGATLIAFVRLIIWLGRLLSTRLNRVLPRRVSIVVSALTVGFLVLLIGNDIVARALLDSADRFFSQADRLIDSGVEQPAAVLATGSEQSLIDWESIGREGKNFIAAGPTQTQISQFLGRPAMQPLRVYVGMRSRETARDRAELALQELQRVGAFDRSVLVVATPTGTGWLDPGGVDSVEYLHAGDTAVVSTQYSYLPSWITILVDPRRSIESAYELFDVVYDHWRTLPKDRRPSLYLHGLSLGSLGSEVAADLYTTFEDPVQGAVWSGPPFPSTQWQQITAHRNPTSPSWLPTYRDQRLVRFTAQKNALSRGGTWGPIRNVYIQHASDPMVFFSASLFYQRPAWLSGTRGPDVSPHLRWYPIITGLQIAFDLPMATSVPVGFGHNYAPASYIDAWVAVSQPRQWSARQTAELKKHFQSSRADRLGST
ncbi:MAG: alpha/beta hydrolase, partial [Planctomycetaceae bacterium]